LWKGAEKGIFMPGNDFSAGHLFWSFISMEGVRIAVLYSIRQARIVPVALD
jgi:hypothetical protein